MEKVILITSRVIDITNYQEIKYGQIKEISGAIPESDENGYFRQFLEWVQNGKDIISKFDANLSDKDMCKELVRKLIADNNPKESGDFLLGIYKRKVENEGPTIYLAEEFPCKGDEKEKFSENKQRYLNSIVVEIKNDIADSNDSNPEIEWLILSHDNDWGQVKKNFIYEEVKGKVPDVFGDLKEVVDATSTRIRLFQHVDEDDTYLYVKGLMTGEFWDLDDYLAKAKEQKLSFIEFLNDIGDIDDIDMEKFRKLNINPMIPFLPI